MVCVQISDTVYPMYKAFIEPDLKKAHLRIYNTFNPFSGFMNATYILKSCKQVSESAIRKVLPVSSPSLTLARCMRQSQHLTCVVRAVCDAHAGHKVVRRLKT